MNTHYFASYKDKFTTYYKAARKERKGESAFVRELGKGLDAGTAFSEHLADAIASLAQLGLSIKPEEIGKLIQPDMDEDVIDIMAEVRAYYQGTEFDQLLP